MMLSERALEVLRTADALSGESTGGGDGREAVAYLLGLEVEQATHLVTVALIAAEGRCPEIGGGEFAMRAAATEVGVLALVTGIELGVAAERLRTGVGS